MLKCKICGCEFNAVKERHYISRNNGKVGLAAAFGSNPEDILYDTFDCPACGCQMTAQERKRAFVLIENFGTVSVLTLDEWKDKYIIHYLSGDYVNCNYHKTDRSKDIEVLITNY